MLVFKKQSVHLRKVTDKKLLINTPALQVIIVWGFFIIYFLLFSCFGLFFVLKKAAILLVILEEEEQIRCSLIRDIISSNAMDRGKILFGLKKSI